MYPCEPDFLIKADKDIEGILPVAVFLDGYRYHKNIVHEDLMKRQGIFLSRKYIVWSLSWHDVNQAFAGAEAKTPNPLRENIADSPKPFIRKMAEQKGLVNHDKIAELSPMLMLAKLLSQPSTEYWRGYSMLRAMNWLDQKVMKDAKIKDAILDESKVWPSQYQDQLSSIDVKFSSTRSFSDTGADLIVHLGGGDNAINSFDDESMFLTAVYSTNNPDGAKTQRVWQKLLQIVNIGQFLPNFFAATEKGINDGSFSELVWKFDDVSPIEKSEWDKVISLAETEVKEFLSKVSADAIPIPSVCFELEDSKGMVIAEAELAWPDKQCALLLDWQLEESGPVFKQYGWTLLTTDSDMTFVIDLLGEQ
jgi:DEAD/DEAH box helicase domain-containing protein